MSQKKSRVVGRRTAKGLLPRRGDVSTVNMKHELFAHEYLVDFDAGAAYVRAGYKVANTEVAKSAGRALLRNYRVWEIIHSEHVKRIAGCKLDAEKTVLELQYCYMQASKSGDWANAIAALRELGKHFGIYEMHQKGKTRYVDSDVEVLKAKLEAAGWNYSYKSYLRVAPVDPAPLPVAPIREAHEERGDES